VEKKDPAAYEERVLQKLNRFFDVLLIHSDENLVRLNETFSRVGDIEIPVVYTGFITQQTDPIAGRKLRRELDISSGEKLIVASAGGGRSGFKLLTCVTEACALLSARMNIRLEVFSGPFMDDGEFERLSAAADHGFRIRRYTRRFMDYLHAADMSVSLAGYNTCMNLMFTRVPALVYPYSRQQEQPMRVNKLINLLPIKILDEEDLHPQRLSRHIDYQLHQSRSSGSTAINMDGAANAAGFINRWMKDPIGNRDKHRPVSSEY
jgi:predicted glycosyltransferase